MKNYVRNILIFVVTFSLVFGLCIVPSFGSSSSFSGQPFITGTQSNNQLDFYTDNIIGQYTSGSIITNIVFGTLYENTYAFTVGNSFYVVLDGAFAQPNFGLGLQSNNSWTSQNVTRMTVDSTTLLRYQLFYTFDTSTWFLNIPNFDNVQDGLNAVKDYIDNPSLPSSNYTNTYGLLNGYAIVFDLGSANQPYDIFVTQVQEHSSTGQFNNVKQTWGWSDTLPDTTTTFPRSSDTIIPYYKTGSDNIWGASNNGFSNKETMVANGFWNETTNSRYLTIYNPYAIPIEQSLKNGAGLQFYYPETINITITGAISYKLISLRSGMTNTGVQGGYTSDENDTVTEEINDSGALNPEIDGKTPEKGGQNENPDDLNPIQSITVYLQNIQQTLSDFANSFISLLQAPISHVRQLISAGSEYFGVIQGLYGWLPDEVQGTINSAMIVSISVGVIALLL